MTEIWRDVIGFEELYQVSDCGTVRSLDRTVRRRHDRAEWIRKGRIMRQSCHKRGSYMHIVLTKNRHATSKKVHHLVLEAFVGPRPNGTVGCHNDGDPTNNHISNLRWDTPSNNNFDLVRHGTHANANKQCCPRGHPYIESNIYRPPGTTRVRVCRTCNNIRGARQQVAS